jgi:hypothetical protein
MSDLVAILQSIQTRVAKTKLDLEEDRNILLECSPTARSRYSKSQSPSPSPETQKPRHSRLSISPPQRFPPVPPESPGGVATVYETSESEEGTVEEMRSPRQRDGLEGGKRPWVFRPSDDSDDMGVSASTETVGENP